MSDFNHFKKLAKNNNLKSYEKVGRKKIHIGKENKEKNIFNEIKKKLDIKKKTVICDIGCGCSLPALNLINFAKKNNNKLILVDSKEMLNNLPNYKYVKKIACKFPNCKKFIRNHSKSIDNIIIYSVLHYVKLDNIFNFLDNAVLMLKINGKILIGDIPNVDKKRRFLSSDFGKKFFRNWSGGKDVPKIDYDKLRKESINDKIVINILKRYRRRGLDTFLLSQGKGLPFNMTREDILMKKVK